MVRPDKMYRVKRLEDFIMYSYAECEFYIEKPLLYDSSVFLLVYEGKYKLSINNDNLFITKLQ